jgi:hypothetical protein
MIRSLFAPAVALALAVSASARADRLVVTPTQEGDAKLLLPSDFLARHKVERPSREEAPGARRSLPTVMAGLALAAGATLAGLLVRRRGSRLVAGLAACGCGALLFLNSSCSPRPMDEDDIKRDFRGHVGAPLRPLHPPGCEDGKVQGELLLEEGALGDSLRLSVSEDALKALAEHHAGKAKE